MKTYLLMVLTIILLLSGHIDAQVVLYPPQNLTLTQVECSLFIKWQKPQNPSGNLPPGLIGYKIYKNNDSIGYNPLPGDTIFWEVNPDPGYLSYNVTAFYDLTSYGYPGQFGESAPSNAVNINLPFCDVLPLSETWDQASFTFNSWKFEPDQGNWMITTGNGNPAPTAEFTGNPAETNYMHILRSRLLPGSILPACSDLWVEFDYKLDNINSTGTEKLGLDLYYDSSWVSLWEATNLSSFDWTHVKIFINQAMGFNFKIGFKASGQNSQNINHWLIDNIYVSFLCKPPLNPLVNNLQNNIVNIYWNSPVCNDSSGTQGVSTGYNVYRTDSTGMPPFYRINTTIIQDTFFIDYIPTILLPEQFGYYITAVYLDSLQFTICYGVSDTVYLILTGTKPLTPSSYRVFPNPSNGIFKIDLPNDAINLEIADLNAKIVYTRDISQIIKKAIQIDLSYLPKGIYPIRFILKNGLIRDKVIIY